MILPDRSDYRLTGTESGFAIIKKSRAPTNPSRHFHPYWELLYILSGERTFFYANRTLHIEAGTLLFIPPGILHRALNPPGEVCCLYNIYFENQSLPSFLSIEPLLHSENLCIEFPPEIRNTIAMLFARIGINMEEKQIGYVPLVWALLTELLVTAVRQDFFPGTLVHSSDTMNRHVASVIDYINAHYRNSLSLERTASQFGISAAYLSREFHRATQFTFIEYVNSLRITHACTLLKADTLNVTEIAEECGFGSITQFGRCFKALTGKSPLAYRKEGG